MVAVAATRRPSSIAALYATRSGVAPEANCASHMRRCTSCSSHTTLPGSAANTTLTSAVAPAVLRWLREAVLDADDAHARVLLPDLPQAAREVFHVLLEHHQRAAHDVQDAAAAPLAAVRAHGHGRLLERAVRTYSGLRGTTPLPCSPPPLQRARRSRSKKAKSSSVRFAAMYRSTTSCLLLPICSSGHSGRAARASLRRAR